MLYIDDLDLLEGPAENNEQFLTKLLCFYHGLHKNLL